MVYPLQVLLSGIIDKRRQHGIAIDREEEGRLLFRHFLELQCDSTIVLVEFMRCCGNVRALLSSYE